MGDDEETEVFMEDTEAKDRSERNPQGSDKRAPDRDQGESVPEGANAGDADAGTATGATGGSTGDGGGASRFGGSSGEGGGASQGGGTGN